MNKTCKDCIHFDVCQYHITEETKMTVNECSHGFKDKSRYIELPCAVGDKVAVRACCECVTTIPDNDECRYICPFEDDCEFDDCDNANERIFNTTISGIFNDGLGWKVTFKNFSYIEANFTDIGTSFFIGENAEQQAKEYEQALKGCDEDAAIRKEHKCVERIIQA